MRSADVLLQQEALAGFTELYLYTHPMNTRIETKKLLGILEENRRKHHATFTEAMDGYRKAAIAELERMISEAKAGKKVQRSLSLIQPVNQTADYDRIIYMLKLTEDPNIVLDEHSFRCYVQDKWNWAKQFATSNKSYTTSASSAAYFAALEGEEEEL